MNLKKILSYFLWILVFLMVTVFVLNKVIEGKLKKALTEEIPLGNLSYKTINVSVLFGDIIMEEVSYVSSSFHLNLEELKIEDVHYWPLFLKDKIEIGRIQLEQPKLVFEEKKQESENAPPFDFSENIHIENLNVRNGSLIFKKQNSDTIFFAEKYSLDLGSIKLNNKTISEKIPFHYRKLSGRAENIYYDLTTYHEFRADKFLFSEKKILVEKIAISPKYSRAEMREIIPYEKDMFTLNINSLTCEAPVFDYNAEQPVFISALMQIDSVNLEVYRDKTVVDDKRKKKMYSEMLRDLKPKLAIEKVELSRTYIQYQERLKPDRPLGIVAFYDMSAEISNLTNKNLPNENFPKTIVDVRTKFMNTTDLHVNWTFNVNSLEDRFTISGNAGNIPPEAMNPFFVPALNIKAKGGIDALYFNFGGNKVRAEGDFRIDYSNFKIEFLKKNGESKNKFLSALANFFVKKNPENGTVTKNGIIVERDQTKSFWNYFWSCIKKGLLKSMT